MKLFFVNINGSLAMYGSGKRDAFAKSHVPVHNRHPADGLLALEKRVHQHFHCPFNEKNYFQNSATEGDLFFLRDFDRIAPYTVPRERPKKREEFDQPDMATTNFEKIEGASQQHRPGAAGGSLVRAAN